MWRAWGAVATTVASVSLSVYLIAISPWYLLPLAWAFAGTAWTGVRPAGEPVGAMRERQLLSLQQVKLMGMTRLFFGLPAACADVVELAVSCCEAGVSAFVMPFTYPNFLGLADNLSHQLWGAAVCGRPRLRTPQLQQKQIGGGHCGHADVHAAHLPF